MNTNYDDEATLYQEAENENTKFEETPVQESNPNDIPDNNEAPAKHGKGLWKRAAIGAGTGLLIGGVSTVLMGMKGADSEPNTETESGNEPENGNNNDPAQANEGLPHPEWVDDQIQVATSVDDGMSFGEAFAAARAEVGAGGCFEWHGQVYGTYTADEWNGMTAEQRAEYGDHFSWNHIDHSQSDVAQHSTHIDNSASQANTAGASGTDDIEVVSVNHDGNNNDMAQAGTGNDSVNAEVVEVSQAEPEVEILGVVHDADSGANIGSMSVDGQEVILIDVDNDMQFDYMAADVNGNGQVDQGELVDIQAQGLTVNGVGGFTDPSSDMIASNDAADYSTGAL